MFDFFAFDEMIMKSIKQMKLIGLDEVSCVVWLNWWVSGWWASQWLRQEERTTTTTHNSNSIKQRTMSAVKMEEESEFNWRVDEINEAN